MGSTVPRPVILLVDDEEDLLRVIQTALRRAMPAYETVATDSIATAEAALDDLEATDTPLALAIVDHILGGQTGLDLMAVLGDRHPGVPCLMFTGQANADVEAAAVKLGAVVLFKPLRLQQLLDRVSVLLPAVDM